MKNFNLKKITFKTVCDSYNCREAVRDSYNCREVVRDSYNCLEANNDSYNCQEAVHDSSLLKKSCIFLLQLMENHFFRKGVDLYLDVNFGPPQYTFMSVIYFHSGGVIYGTD